MTLHHAKQDTDSEPIANEWERESMHGQRSLPRLNCRDPISFRERQFNFAVSRCLLVLCTDDGRRSGNIERCNVVFERLSKRAARFRDHGLLGEFLSAPRARPLRFTLERCGAFGDGFETAHVYETDPATPIGCWKEVWEAAKKRSKCNVASMVCVMQHAHRC